jgi:hypothetical protein
MSSSPERLRQQISDGQKHNVEGDFGLLLKASEVLNPSRCKSIPLGFGRFLGSSGGGRRICLAAFWIALPFDGELLQLQKNVYIIMDLELNHPVNLRDRIGNDAFFCVI